VGRKILRRTIGGFLQPCRHTLFLSFHALYKELVIGFNEFSQLIFSRLVDLEKMFLNKFFKLTGWRGGGVRHGH
jgi:hypothetical protein